MANGFPAYTGQRNLWAFLHYLFDNQGAGSLIGANSENSLWVDPVNGNDNQSGKSFGEPLATITQTLTFASAGGYIFLAPGQYDETVAIPRALSNLTLIGYGGRGSAFIEPTTEDAAGMTVDADDVTLINVGVAGEDETSAVALTVTGSRFRAYGCKFEGGLTQILIGPGTVAQEDAGTKGRGGDSLFDDCEICWGTNGFVLQGTDFGGCTQIYIRNCRFHDLTAESVGEAVGSGGSAGVTFFGLNVKDCVFEEAEDGTQPTNWFDLDADNANTGIVSNCQFTVALAGTAKNVVSTSVIWTGNYHTGGLSTGQPS